MRQCRKGIMSDLDLQFGAWMPIIKDFADEAWCTALFQRVEDAYNFNNPRVFPPKKDLFAALRLTPPTHVKCVILGQDPYHEEGQAHGLSFSVPKGVSVPRSLKNIYKELQSDLGCIPSEHGCLEYWAEQGVLLLNTVLSVYEGEANSHKNWGWEDFTSRLIDKIETLPQPIAYILWGKQAQKKIKQNSLGDGPNPRLIISSNHPSPLSASRGFFGSRPFSQVNEFLINNGCTPIDWQLK